MTTETTKETEMSNDELLLPYFEILAAALISRGIIRIMESNEIKLFEKHSDIICLLIDKVTMNMIHDISLLIEITEGMDEYSIVEDKFAHFLSRYGGKVEALDFSPPGRKH